MWQSLQPSTSQQKMYVTYMRTCFTLPFRHKSGCEVYVVHGISSLKGFHFFIKVRGSPLFHIALNPRTLRDLNAWNHTDILAVKQRHRIETLTSHKDMGNLSLSKLMNARLQEKLQVSRN
jgi:hypothetical protein